MQLWLPCESIWEVRINAIGYPVLVDEARGGKGEEGHHLTTARLPTLRTNSESFNFQFNLATPTRQIMYVIF